MTRNHSRKWVLVALIALSFSACRKDATPPPNEETIDEEVVAGARSDHGNHHSSGYVYTLNNQVSSNKVLVYRRANDGELSFVAAYSTGGKGTGAGLGSQGALTLTEKNDMLLAVNAGDNTLSSFKVSGNRLHLVSKVSSGGMMPISVTEHDDLVYVVNAGGNGNISGFKLGHNGRLYPLPHSTKPLSSNMSGPAQISFVNDGKVLVITEKMTNKIITYTVNHWGTPGTFHSITSASPTPFGFGIKGYGNIIVSEAAGGAPGASVLSSYWVLPNGSIRLIEGSVSAGQTAACWVVITDNKKFVYATNTGSNNLSSFKTRFDGGINLLNAVAATSGEAPIDAALSRDSKYLYVLNDMSGSISAYNVNNNNGSLSSVQTVTGLPAGTVGLAAK
jgi:6-phosphogluconolactonase